MPTYSPVVIGRMALSHIGVSTNFENITEKTPEVAQFNTWYDAARRQTLEAFNWSFARSRQALATHTLDPPDGQWAYRYQYPATALKVRQLIWPSWTPDMDAAPFSVELASDDTKTIVTNVEQATAIFTKDLENVALWTDLAIQALTRLLAAYMAPALTTEKMGAQRQFQIYAAMIGSLQDADANEQMGAPPRDAPWVRGR